MGGTAAYARWREPVPPLVVQAVARARDLGFELCVRPEIGRLLGVLAGGLPPGSSVGESGTGTGAGLGWMVSAAAPDVRFVSFELDVERAAAATELFADHDNVDVVCGDAAELFGRGPFDLLVHDGGPGAGKSGEAIVPPSSYLAPGGTITMDDLAPTDAWPPLFGGSPDTPRINLIEHPDLLATEVRVAPDLAMIVARHLPPRA